MAYELLTEIARPIHVHGVRTDAEYAALQLDAMKRLQAARPANKTPLPYDVPEETPARIVGSKWIVDCACGNAPSASPEWNVARCLECGATYRNIRWPKDFIIIESILLVRPRSAQRAWDESETVEDLRNENFYHGLRGNL